MSPLASRRLTCRGRETISRIVVFGEDVTLSVPKDHHGNLLPRRDTHYDYDSCLSPVSASETRSQEASELLRSFVANYDMRMRSTSGDDSHDFDSCISPVSTPRWTRSQLNEVKGSHTEHNFHELHSMLVDGFITHFTVRRGDDGRMVFEVCPTIADKSIIVSGSFNPIHQGHENLAMRAVREAPGASGQYFFEMSTVNVDKGPLSAGEAERRVDLILNRGHSCILTNAILFDAKAEIFPNCIFAIGFDTYIRVVNPAYYPRVTGGLDATLARIESRGCEFFVGGRLTNGIYKALSPSPRLRSVSAVEETIELEMETVEISTFDRVFKSSNDVASADSLEEPMSPIFSGIPDFRYDISSTEIRKGKLLQFTSQLPP